MSAFAQSTDADLLDTVMESNLPAEEKARVVLAVRERQVLRRHNSMILALTIVLAIGTVPQGAHDLYYLVTGRAGATPSISDTQPCLSRPMLPTSEENRQWRRLRTRLLTEEVLREVLSENPITTEERYLVSATCDLRRAMTDGSYLVHDDTLP